MTVFHSRIVGTGSYLPQNVVTNADLAAKMDTSDEWIRQRTGIRERHIAAENENSSDLALKASQRALEMAGISADQLDLIIVATSTPDMVFPSTACILQAKLGAKGMPAWLPSACSGAASMPGLSLRFSTTAPAPSPNSTQVVRSLQSRMREKVSAPITSARLWLPQRNRLSAIDSA